MTEQTPQLLQTDEINALWELVKVWHRKNDKAETYFGKVCRQVPNTSFNIPSEPFLYDETDITVHVREDWDENTKRFCRICAIKNYDTSSQICLGAYSGYSGEEAEKYFLKTRRIVENNIRAERERQAQASRFSLENALSEARRIVADGGRQ